MNKPENALLYLLVFTSLLLHIVAVLVIRTETIEKKKEKEPIVVDIMGPLKAGPATVLPAPNPNALPLPEPPEPRQQQRVAKAAPQRQRMTPPLRPSVPSIPIPASQPPSMPRAGLPRTGGDGVPAPSPPASSEVRSAPSRPSPPSGWSPGSAPERPGKLKRPSFEDLERYANVDKEVQRPKDDQSITLDTDDLMYASYMQGMKKRIELIWKYPETARQDGLQGSLVMRFTIAKSGRVGDIDILKSSGYPLLDDAAKQALIDASPFNPLPDSWKKESFTITGTFVYRLYGMYVR
ncbi:MAG: TonB family protein [Nitrospirae bacterium]|nr:TonB family protein [Nitrospirota bacterium]